LGKEFFGRWGLIFGATSTFAQFAGFGMSLTVTRHVAMYRRIDPARAGRTLCFCMVISLASISLLSLLLLCTAGVLATNLYHVSDLAVPLAVASGILFFMVLTGILQGVLAGFEDFSFIAISNVIQGVALLLGVIILAQLFGLVGVVIAESLSYALTSIYCLWIVLIECRKHGIVLGTAGIWQERNILWRYGVPNLLTAAALGPATMISQAFVSRTAGGLLGLGGYEAAVRWRTVVLFVPQAVRRVTLPMLAKLRGENDYRRFVKALLANVVLNGGVALSGALPVALLSPWIMSLYGPGFRQDWDMMVVLVASGVFQAVNDVVTQVLAAMEKMWWNFAIHVIWATVMIGGSALLVPDHGARGYVWAFATATVLHMLLNTSAAIIVLKRSDFSSSDQINLNRKESL
jgi:O-antigen/teichoic acid export membrane protein